MPKVYLSENQRLNARLSSWLYGEMKIKHITQKEMAYELGISQPALAQKIRNNKYSFEDFLTFVRVLKPDTKDLERLVGR